jgi:hypothetical protein
MYKMFTEVLPRCPCRRLLALVSLLNAKYCHITRMKLYALIYATCELVLTAASAAAPYNPRSQHRSQRADS